MGRSLQAIVCKCAVSRHLCLLVPDISQSVRLSTDHGLDGDERTSPVTPRNHEEQERNFEAEDQCKKQCGASETNQVVHATIIPHR